MYGYRLRQQRTWIRDSVSGWRQRSMLGSPSICCRAPSSSPTSPHRAWRRVWRGHMPSSARSSWSTPTCPSGNPCCMEWPSFIPPCRRDVNSAPLAGTFHMSSTRPISHLLCSLCRIILMIWIPRRYGLNMNLYRFYVNLTKNSIVSFLCARFWYTYNYYYSVLAEAKLMMYCDFFINRFSISCIFSM